MNILKKLVKKITPRFVLRSYHFLLAWLGAFLYGFPSRRMVTIGIVGTRGKTTVANLVWSCLSEAGYKTGLTGTANIRVGAEERLNPYHMTMPGRFTLQKILREMADAGCAFAVVETPSEGVEQFRHKGIFYDAAVLTTLYPEYLEVHGWSYDRCLDMHEVIFRELARQPRKILNNATVKKVIVVQNDAKERERFMRHDADVKVTYALRSPADVHPDKISLERGVEFSVSGAWYRLGLSGEYNIENALAAVALCLAFRIPVEAIHRGLLLPYVPGRMERIMEAESFDVFVDYAHDAVSLEAILSSLRKTAKMNLIVVFGGQGGGRDVKKLPVMGEVSGKYADVVILTTDDPFDDDPEAISEKIAPGAESKGKKRGENLFLITDRREAIRKALALARKGDVVLIAGKGAEQSMMTKKGKIPWDDRGVVREELKRLVKDIQ